MIIKLLFRVNVDDLPKIIILIIKIEANIGHK